MLFSIARNAASKAAERRSEEVLAPLPVEVTQGMVNAVPPEDAVPVRRAVGVQLLAPSLTKFR